MYNCWVAISHLHLLSVPFRLEMDSMRQNIWELGISVLCSLNSLISINFHYVYIVNTPCYAMLFIVAGDNVLTADNDKLCASSLGPLFSNETRCPNSAASLQLRYSRSLQSEVAHWLHPAILNLQADTQGWYDASLKPPLDWGQGGRNLGRWNIESLEKGWSTKPRRTDCIVTTSRTAILWC